MKIPSELGFVVAASAAAGWMLSRGSYVGGGVFALVAAGFYWEFERSYRRDRAAAKSWRLHRWNELKALETKYRNEVKPGPGGPQALMAAWNDAERRAEAEITERLGPIV